MSKEHSISRRRLLGSSAATAAAAVIAAGVPATAAAAAPARRWSGAPGSSGVRLRWLGNNAWEIRFGATTLLVDPWLTRFPTGTYTPAGIRDDTPLTVDPTKIDPHITAATHILVCHGHFDHLTDVPYIAGRSGATVWGTESHLNMLRALDAPAAQLSTIRGGERIQLDGFTVDVFESLHSQSGARRQVPFPGTRPGPVPPRPATVADLVEGGTLAYLITVANGFRILVLSTANYIETQLAGTQPDLAFVAAGGGSVPDYADRLMRVLDYPRWVLPTHWDDFNYPLDQPAIDWGGLVPLREAVAAASPHTTFVTLAHLETFVP